MNSTNLAVKNGLIKGQMRHLEGRLNNQSQQPKQWIVTPYTSFNLLRNADHYVQKNIDLG
jgi:hypothetical protein